MNYYEKYLKYKEKYINLKRLLDLNNKELIKIKQQKAGKIGETKLPIQDPYIGIINSNISNNWRGVQVIGRGATSQVYKIDLEGNPAIAVKEINKIILILKL